MATTLDQKKNFSLATTTTPLGIADTSWTLTAGQGANLPDTASGAFDAVLWDQTSSPDNPFRSTAGFEIVRVNTRATDTISSMTRAQQGTSAIALTVGPSFAIAAVPTALDWDNVRKMIQEQASNYAIATGTATALTIDLDPAPTAYIDGAVYKFEAALDSTGTGVTVNFNGIGAKSLKEVDGKNIYKTELKAGAHYVVTYVLAADQFHLQTPPFSTFELINSVPNTGTCTGGPTNYTYTPNADVNNAGQQSNQVGASIRFVAPATNTGAANLILLGNTDAITKKDGAALTARDIISGDVIELVRIANGGDWQLMSAGVTREFPPAYIDGAQISFNTVSTVDIAAGNARDSTDIENITWTGTLTADITASGANGLDTGTEAADTWYAVHVISGAGNPVASLLSLSATAPTLPGTYTVFRRVGWVRNDATSAFLEMRTKGKDRSKNVFYYTGRGSTQVLGGGSATTFTTIDLSSFVPPTSEMARLMGRFEIDTGAAGDEVRLKSVSTDTSSTCLRLEPGHVSADKQSWPFVMEIDTNQSIEYRVDSAGNKFTMYVCGYIDEV